MLSNERRVRGHGLQLLPYGFTLVCTLMCPHKHTHTRTPWVWPQRLLPQESTMQISMAPRSSSDTPTQMISAVLTLTLHPIPGTFCHAPVGPGRSIHWSQQCLTFPAGDEDSETQTRAQTTPMPLTLYLLFHMVYTRVFQTFLCLRIPQRLQLSPTLKLSQCSRAGT